MARVVVPLASGFSQDVDPKVLPSGALRSVKNLRLRRRGQLAARYGYDALALDSHDQDIVAADLFAHDGRLLALASTGGEASPTDLVEFINQPLQTWRHSQSIELNGTTNGKRLNSIEHLRDLSRGQPIAAPGGSEILKANVSDCAAANGLVCSVYNSFNNSYLDVLDASTNRLVVADRISGVEPRCVASNGRFFVVHRSGSQSSQSDTLQLRVFNPAASNSFTLVGTISSSPSGLTSYDVVPRADPNDGFVVVESRGTTVTVRLFDGAGSAGTTWTITGPTDSTPSVLVTSDPDERISVAIKDHATTTANLRTFSLAGTLLNGPTVISSADTAPATQQVGLVSVTGTTIAIFTSRDVSGEGPKLHCSRRNVTTHTALGDAGDDYLVDGLRLAGRPLALDGTSGLAVIVPAVRPDEGQGTADNVLFEWAPTDMLCAILDRDVAFEGLDKHLASLVRDSTTGRYYYSRQIQDTNGATTAIVSQFRGAERKRRQMFAVNNTVYVPSALLQMWDTRTLFEAAFSHAPVIVSAVGGGSFGFLTANEQYSVVAVYEWFDARGDKHESAPSNVETVLLGGSDTALDVVVRNALTQRYNFTNSAELFVQLVIYRTLAAPDTTLHRDRVVPLSLPGVATSQTIQCTQSDDDLSAQGIVYTQAATGARSGPEPFVAPDACTYAWPSAEKVLTAGLPYESRVQESRAAFINEPVSWSPSLGGFRGLRSRVLAVASLDERRIVFTEDEIYQVDGEGLDINGVGDLGGPRKLPAACGLFGGEDGWRSVVESDAGLFYQGTSGLIYLLPRGGGAPVDVGAPVQDTLELFPVITAAVYNQGEQTVAFACNDSGETAGTLLVYDIVEQQWFQDDTPGAIRSLAVLDQRLVVLDQDGTIRQQRTTHPADTDFVAEIISGTIHPFSPGMEGQVDLVQLVGDFMAECVIRMYLSRDDGQTEEELAEAVLSDRDPGSTFTLSRKPYCMNGNRFRLRITVEGHDGPTEGVRFTYAVLHCTSAKTPMLTDDEDNG